MEPESKRYVEYLQRQLLTPGSELIHDAENHRKWFEENREKQRQLAKTYGADTSLINEFERTILEFSPETEFDTASSRAIFEPILDEVLISARNLAIAPQRPIVLAASTDLSSGPVARPSTGEHILFAGVGTYCFCNYWAKVYSIIVANHVSVNGEVPVTADGLFKSFARDPTAVSLAARLALYYSCFGTTAGFDIVTGDGNRAYRLLVLNAMEVFAVAHEVGHFYYEERRPTHSTDVPDKTTEFACDLYALTVSREFASRSDNWLLFTGAGAVFLLFAHRISILLRPDDARAVSDSHPAMDQRIATIINAVKENTDADQLPAVAAYIDEVTLICSELGRVVHEVLIEAVRRSP